LKRRTVIIGAIRVVLRRLARLADGPEVRVLREQALAYLREVEEWKDRSPPAERRDGLMKELLDLHVRARRLTSWNPPK
jgi:hypothetical protein